MKQECPKGHSFGADCMTGEYEDDCEECPIWNQCREAFDKDESSF